MKWSGIFLLGILLIKSCKKPQKQADILPSNSVWFQINYNLHRGEIGFSGGYKVFPNQGLRGVVVTNMGDENFKAFDLACPHLLFELCKKGLTTNAFPFLKCPCDKITYHINVPYQTIGETTYYLKTYRVIFESGKLTVGNF